MSPPAVSKTVLLKICYNYNFLVFKFDFLWNLFFDHHGDGGHSLKKAFSYFSISEKVQKKKQFWFWGVVVGEEAKIFQFVFDNFFKSPDLLRTYASSSYFFWAADSAETTGPRTSRDLTDRKKKID